MRFSTFVFRNVLRRPIRSTLTITGMAVAVTAVVALVGLSDGFTGSMRQQYQGVSLIVTRKDSVSPLNTTMPEKVAQDIAALPDVGDNNICPGLLNINNIEELGTEPLAIQGWPAGNYRFRDLTMTDGRMLTENDLLKKRDLGKKDVGHPDGQRDDRARVLVGENLAALKSVKIGDQLTISEKKCQVVGIYKSPVDLENNMVLMLLPDAQYIFGQLNPPLITGCTVKVHDPTPEKVKTIANDIDTRIAEENHLPGKLKASSPETFLQANKQISMFRGFAWAVSIIALVIGGIGVLNTMFMSVFERTREIGILRAIGWRPRRVMRMILWESATLSIVAGVVGVLAGLAIIRSLGLVPVLAGPVQSAINWTIVLKGFSMAMLVGVLGALYPAFRGSRLLPTEALRHE